MFVHPTLEMDPTKVGILLGLNLSKAIQKFHLQVPNWYKVRTGKEIYKAIHRIRSGGLIEGYQDYLQSLRVSDFDSARKYIALQPLYDHLGLIPMRTLLRSNELRTMDTVVLILNPEGDTIQEPYKPLPQAKADFILLQIIERTDDLVRARQIGICGYDFDSRLWIEPDLQKPTNTVYDNSLHVLPHTILHP